MLFYLHFQRSISDLMANLSWSHRSSKRWSWYDDPIHRLDNSIEFSITPPILIADRNFPAFFVIPGRSVDYGHTATLEKIRDNISHYHPDTLDRICPNPACHLKRFCVSSARMVRKCRSAMVYSNQLLIWYHRRRCRNRFKIMKYGQLPRNLPNNWGLEP